MQYEEEKKKLLEKQEEYLKEIQQMEIDRNKARQKIVEIQAIQQHEATKHDQQKEENQKLKSKEEHWQREKNEMQTKFKAMEEKQQRDAASIIEWERECTVKKEECRQRVNEKIAAELERDNSRAAEKQLQENQNELRKLKAELEAKNKTLTREMEDKDGLLEDQRSEIKELKKMLKGSQTSTKRPRTAVRP